VHFHYTRREQQEQIALEDKYRRTFAENPSDPSIQDPHLTLINVFENTGRFDYAEETPEEVRPVVLVSRKWLRSVMAPKCQIF
jgi:hypothetical protein